VFFLVNNESEVCWDILHYLIYGKSYLLPLETEEVFGGRKEILDVGILKGQQKVAPIVILFKKTSFERLNKF